jgi:hypothetical protein
MLNYISLTLLALEWDNKKNLGVELELKMPHEIMQILTMDK